MKTESVNRKFTNDEEPLYLLNSSIVSQILKENELKVVNLIQKAYQDHYEGKSVLPHSIFLRFPGNASARIIGLPGYISGDFSTAGIKWISSFPNNIELGIDRASAVLILNSMKTGKAKAVLESSIISATRTAASAMLPVIHIAPKNFEVMALVGCGVIGFEILRFAAAVNPSLKKLLVNDLSLPRAEHFRRKCEQEFPSIKVEFVSNINQMLSLSPVTALATTASVPYLYKLPECQPGSLILNISLRDLSPEIILSSNNIVDDPAHVCRENTSIHLAEKVTGNRDFINGTIAELSLGTIKLKTDTKPVTIYSPFGLGILDLVLGEFVLQEAIEKNLGICISDFFPKSWSNFC